MVWPPTTHQDVQDELGALRHSATDKVYYVSKNGSNSNSGLSWGAALASVDAAFSKLGFGPGTIEIGAGTFSASGLVPNFGQVLRGRGRLATLLQLDASGTLINATNLSNIRFEHLGLKFASASVTGTLINMSNTFTCDFEDVAFSGQKVAGQVGISLTNNAGDSQFVSCYWDNLDVGVQNDSTVNHFIGCVFSSNLTAGLRGGDATGATAACGFTATDCTFRGTGAYYIQITGLAQACHVKGCWFDGSGATTAVQVGTGTFGPWIFSVVDCPSMLGGTNSLVINAAKFVQLHGVMFGNGGSNPVDLTVNATNAPRGSISSCFSLQGNKLETLVPPRWKGATGYTQSADGTVSLIETYSDMNVTNTPLTARRVMVRVAGRTTGTAAVTLTFPSAFESAAAKTFDNTAIGAGLTFSNTSITIPTGVAVSNGLVILEGF